MNWKTISRLVMHDFTVRKFFISYLWQPISYQYKIILKSSVRNYFLKYFIPDFSDILLEIHTFGFDSFILSEKKKKSKELIKKTCLLSLIFIVLHFLSSLIPTKLQKRTAEWYTTIKFTHLLQE